MSTSAPRRFLPLLLLAVIFLLGLFLRLTALTTSQVSEPIRGDARSYFFYGVNLHTDGVYARSLPRFYGGQPPRPDAVVGPVYPLFVSALMSERWKQGSQVDADYSIRPVLFVQTLLGSLLVLLVYGLGRRFLGTGPALVAAFLTAISPHLVNIGIYLLTETLFMLLFWLGLWLLARGLAPEQRRAGLLAAAVLGLAALTRPVVQYLPFLLALWLIMRTPASWRRWGGFVGVFLLVFGAWGVRNLISVGSFGDPLAMVATLQHGSYPDFMYRGLPASLGIPYRFDPEMSLATPLAETVRIIFQRALAAPGEYLHWYALGKPLALFHWELIPVGTAGGNLLTGGDIYIYPTPVTPYAGHALFKATYLLSYVCYRPLLLLAVLATVLAWLPACRAFWGESLDMMRLLSLTFLYVIGLHTIGAPFPRYAIPFQPLLYLMAAGLAAAAWRHYRAGRQIERGAGLL